MKNLLYILFLIFSITFGYAQEVVAQDLQSTNVNYTIKGIKYDEKNKRIIIIGDAGAGNESDRGSGEDSQEVLPGGKDYTIIDTEGNVWAVDEEGNITNVGGQAKGGASTPQNTAGVDAKGNATAITAEGIRVTFKNSSDSKYAFDQPAKALNSDYKALNGKLIPFKAVENKKTEPFIASVEITDNSISADSLIFKTSKGVPIDAKKVGNDYRLTLKGLYSYATEQVQAIIKQGDKYQVAGAFNLVHISPKTIKLNLVPTLGVSISDEHQVQEIKKIYKEIAIDVDISVKEAFDITPYLVNGKLPSEDAFGDLSSYSPAQNKVIEAYKQQRGVDLSYYIFVTDKPSSNGQDGYMRLGGQFGFVYDQQARTIAHELGHGALRLEHPFKTFKNVAQGDMKTLMDYNTSDTNTNTNTNTNFIYPDWKQVNDPKFKIYAFQKQSEGELLYKIWLTPDWVPFKYNLSDKIEILKSNVNGSIEAIWGVENGKYTDKIFKYDKDRKGYIYRVKYDNSSGKDSIFQTLSINTDLLVKDTTTIFILDNNALPCGKYYSAKWGYLKSRKGKLTFNKNQNITYRGDVICIDENVSDLPYDMFFYRIKKGDGNNNANINSTVIDFSGGFTEEQIKEMIKSVTYSTSKAGSKGRIIITSKEKTSKQKLKIANQIFNNPQDDEIIVWMDVKNAETKDFEIKINAGSNLKDTGLFDLLAKMVKHKDCFLTRNMWGTENPLTYTLDALAEMLRKEAKIPEKFYNPNREDYNPFLVELYSSVSLSVINDKLGSIILDTQYTKSQIEFAFVCGIWNEGIESLASIPEGASDLIKIILNEDNARTKFAESISNISLGSINTMLKNVWDTCTGNPCMVSYCTGRATFFVATCFIGVGEIKGATAIIQMMEKLDVMGQLMSGALKVAGKVIKPVIKVSGKAVKYVLKEGVSFVRRVDIKVTSKGLSCGFPIQNINIQLKNKIEELNADVLKQKVSKAIEEEGGLAKLPKDENGNYLLDIEVNGEKVPVLVGENSSLDKIDLQVSSLDNLASKPYWSKADITKLAENLDESIDLSQFTNKLNDLGDNHLKQFHYDYFKSKNATDLQSLIKNTDDLERWKLLKENPDEAFEIARENPSWEKWSKTNFFKNNTRLGRSLNDKIVSALKNKQGKLFDELAEVSGIPIKDLQKYDVLTEVPLETTGGFMKADIVLVLKDELDNISDVIIIENKLSKTTAFTKRQKEGFGAILQNGKHTMKVKYDVKTNEDYFLYKKQIISVSKDKIFKISDGGTDDITKVTIEKITKIN
ncbi:hypothetical protein ACQ1Q5_02770 [Ornithobacterium rhinotracheale]